MDQQNSGNICVFLTAWKSSIATADARASKSRRPIHGESEESRRFRCSAGVVTMGVSPLDLEELGGGSAASSYTCLYRDAISANVQASRSADGLSRGLCFQQSSVTSHSSSGYRLLATGRLGRLSTKTSVMTTPLILMFEKGIFPVNICVES